MKNMKRRLASLLAALMLITVLPVDALAAQLADGTSGETVETATPPEETGSEKTTPDAAEPEESEPEASEPDTAEPEASEPEENPGETGAWPIVIHSPDDVIYNTGSLEITVGSNEERASVYELLTSENPNTDQLAELGDKLDTLSEEDAAAVMLPYKLFNADGSYTIELTEENPYFPYEVQFTYAGETSTKWFKDVNDTVIIGGHTFKIHTDSEPETMGIWIGNDYVPLYPEAKEFTNNLVAPMSMMDLEVKYFRLDLTSYLPGELKSVKISEILTTLKGYSSNTTASASDNVAVWKRYGLYDKETGQYLYEEYTIVDSATLDMSYGSYGSYDSFQMEFIVGTDDQLDTTNVRYSITVNLAYLGDLIEFGLKNAVGTDIPKRVSFGMNQKDGYYNVFYNNNTPTQAKLTLALNTTATAWKDTTATFYYYPEKDGNAVPIPSDGISVDTTNSAYTTIPIAVDLAKTGHTSERLEFDVQLYGQKNSTYLTSRLYCNGENIASSSGKEIDEDGFTLLELNPGYIPNKEYQLQLRLNSISVVGDSSKPITVKSAYEGRTQTDTGTDIHEALFSTNTTNLYTADFSGGKWFTVFDSNGNRYEIGIKAIEYNSYVDPFLNSATQLNINGAVDNNSRSYKAWVMPSDADSYYNNGFRTIFLMNDDDQDSRTPDKPVTATSIIPKFSHSSASKVYKGMNSHTEEQTSGESKVDFNPSTCYNDPIQYTVSSEDGKHAKNYWVTFVTPQTGGAKLYVNGINEKSLWDKTDNLPVREIFFGRYGGTYHDIFIANIGDQDLTGLSVSLEGAENIALDEYWTIKSNGTKTLKAFTTVTSEHGWNGLNNVAKIRLVPTSEDQTGLISGTLVIKYNGGEQKIKLTGMAGDPEIITEALDEGVQYVHYSHIIQTNYMYGSGDIKFSYNQELMMKELGFDLESIGLELKENGEIYGVPKLPEDTEFPVEIPITVTAKMSTSSTAFRGNLNWTSTKKFTLTIKENTDENVWLATDLEGSGEASTYEVTVPIGDLESTYHYVWEEEGDALFKTEGPYSYFIDVYLDGDMLTPDSDYSHEPGSTKITVRAQTMKKLNTGKHTISVGFREGNKETGTLKRAAQNFTKTGKVKPSTSNPSTGNTSSSNNNNNSSSNNNSNNSSNNNTNSNNSSVTRPSGSVTTKRPTSSNSSTSSKPSTSPSPAASPTPSATIPAEAQPGKKNNTPAETVFKDIKQENWFYSDVNWVYQQGLMVGIGTDDFAPESSISTSMIFTVLARMLNVDLSKFTDVGDTGVSADKWYTSALVWAKKSGVLSGETKVNPDEPFQRGDLAVVLVNYLKEMNADVSMPKEKVVFTDADLMTQEQQDAFQILFDKGIFKGIGNNTMGVEGSTSRAQLAALVHRVSDYANKK